MFQTKSSFVGGSIIGVFLLVYGTAIVFRLLLGNYFMSTGLTDSNYLYLALLCAIPFVLSSLIGNSDNHKQHFSSIVMSGVLFSVLFIVVHGVFVFSVDQATDAAFVRALIVLPISALLVIIATRIGLNRAL